VNAIARQLAAQSGTEDWTYRGKEDAAETRLVTAEMPDHSRRVLRDRDARTGDLTWGYYGTGSHDLASVLLSDILADHRWCPDCLGTIPLAANILNCRACSNTGMRPGTRRAESDLLQKVIAELPEEFEQSRLELLRAIDSVQPPEPAIAASGQTPILRKKPARNPS
jgi:hypothetical protein